MSNGYSPASYDQLVAAYQRGGLDEMAELALIARPHRRCAAAGRTARVRGALQRYTVGYGYRPWLAVCWLIGLWVLGTAWFPAHQPMPVDAGQNPAWNPWLFAADTLLPT